MMEKTFNSSLLLVLINYNQHNISVLTNIFDIKNWKRSLEYQNFSNIYGEILVDSKSNKLNSDEVDIPNHTILISKYDSSSSGKVLETDLVNALTLLDVPLNIIKKMIINIMETYNNRGSDILNHHIKLINKIFMEQEIKLELESSIPKEKKEHTFYKNHFYSNEK